jgi:DNA helicase II / ATP-dependent DNA helicase PcrA
VNREKLRVRFLEEYERLNDKQKVAVNNIEGPVMVIAGPGTGKTQILATRVGKILLETDTLPENILCLTYTDAGVVAMRKRLLQFIGPDAYKVNIYTFHAFCNDVIQENLGRFEKTSLDPISELEKTALLKQLIDSFPKTSVLKRYRGDVYFEINNLKQLFGDMKREGWTAEYINKSIDEFLELVENCADDSVYYKDYKYLKNYGANAAGSLKPKFNELKERLEKLRAAANEFDRFQELMRSRNRYDFDDMINWVIKAFEEDKNLLARYQEQYLYVLVDEYQDTSNTQNRIVELLISYWQRPNVFVVGDDDQSIYRFQGANEHNMAQFMCNYSDLLLVVLENNYRSTQPILDISNSLIERNEGRLIRTRPDLQLTKNLTSSHPEMTELKNSPAICEYETQRQEMIGITVEVEKLLSAGIATGKIGIIYKENKYGEELSEFFRLRKIPVYSKRSVDILKIPLAQKVLLFLKYIAAQHDIPYGGDEMLFEILHFSWFNIPPMEIAKLSVEAAEKQFSGNKTSLRRLLYEKAAAPARDLFSPGLHPGLKIAGNAVEKMIGAVPNLTLQQLFELIIRESGILQFIMQSPDKIWLMQVITALFDFVKEETRRDPTLNLQDLINLIELMEMEGIGLPVTQTSGSEKGVNLMTAHGSKGLEFMYVFIAGANASFWEKKKRPYSGYKMPDTIFKLQSKQMEGEEIRRLFYVALTRAEKHLRISYSRFKNDGKELEPSMFIAEIQDRHNLPIEKVPISEELIAEFSILFFNEAEAPEIEKMEEDWINHLLTKFVMNVTALNNYLKCPLEFYFKNLVRIPSPKNEATEFGSAVHDALEKLFRKMQDSGIDVFPPKEEFIKDFEWYMHRHRESFTKEQFARRLEYGQEVLAHYYDEHIKSFNKVVAIERRINNVLIEGIPVKGKLDKLEFEGNSVNVVDYKTGDADKAIEKLKPPDEKNLSGGDYWRQAVFYKILVDNYELRKWKVVSTEFDFVEPDKKKKYQRKKIIITPEDIAVVTSQIKTVWEKIQSREFYRGCGKEGCHWCNFVKTNNLAIALHDLQEAEEETTS